MTSSYQRTLASFDSIKKKGTLCPLMVAELPLVTDLEHQYGQSIFVTHNTPVEPSVSGSTPPLNRLTPVGYHRRDTPNQLPVYDSESVFQPGSRLVDRYEVLQKIGEGGMSLVYEAFDEIRNEHVALKILRPHLAASPQLQQRFLQEGRLSSSFSHPNIARVYDLHQTESLIMLSMELLHGSTLRHDMERRKSQGQTTLPIEVLAMIQQVSKALGVVHASKVIHRDLKPENLWLGLDKSLKVMDFGIARDSMKVAYTIGPRGSGTPFYSAPEQLMASPALDHRADQYSLAIIAYEMLTGELPQGAIHAPHVSRPRIPRKLSLAIFRAMNSDPKKRFPDIQAFAEAAQFSTKTSPWLRTGILLGGMGLVAASGFGIQHALLPWLNRESSSVTTAALSLDIKEKAEVVVPAAKEFLNQLSVHQEVTELQREFEEPIEAIDSTVDTKFDTKFDDGSDVAIEEITDEPAEAIEQLAIEEPAIEPSMAMENAEVVESDDSMRRGRVSLGETLLWVGLQRLAAMKSVSPSDDIAQGSSEASWVTGESSDNQALVETETAEMEVNFDEVLPAAIPEKTEVETAAIEPAVDEDLINPSPVATAPVAMNPVTVPAYPVSSVTPSLPTSVPSPSTCSHGSPIGQSATINQVSSHQGQVYRQSLPTSHPSWPANGVQSSSPLSKLSQGTRVIDAVKYSIQKEIKSHLPGAFRRGSHR